MFRRLSQAVRWFLRSGAVFWLLALALLLWLARQIPLAEALATLRQLRPLQLLILAVVNTIILFLLSGRWWVILRGQGHALGYARVTAYRLAAFAVSYVTPGPHFGGEPVQIFLPSGRDGVPGVTAAAAVALDKTLELLANFTVLALGALVIIWLGLAPGSSTRTLAGFILALLALPGLYLISAWSGRQPLSWILARLPASPRYLEPARSAEQQVTHFCQSRPRYLLAAALFSAIAWLAMLAEYWLMARFLGMDYSPLQALAALTAARFAYLLPFPGGLGALEASQALAAATLGYDPAAGAALALLIRARDVILALVGLILLARLGGRGRFARHADSEVSTKVG